MMMALRLLPQQTACCPQRQLHAVAVRPNTLVIMRFKPSSTVEAPLSQAAPVAADSSVTLKFNGKEQKLRLINNKIHVNAVKEAFNLKSVQLDGQLEPVDQLGFTVTEFSPGQVVNVSGSPLAELESLNAEIAALRTELQALQDMRADLRNVAFLSNSINSMNESYDDLRRLMEPTARIEDLAVIKRLLAEIVMGSRDSPDFTKTSQDGYTFDHWWEGRMIAKDIVNNHSEAKPHTHTRKHRHHDDMSSEEVMQSFHAT
jgi:hypothetical protein